MAEPFRNEEEEEQSYFDHTIEEIRAQLAEEESKGARLRDDLIEQRQEMWEDAAHFSDDFDRLSDFSQYLNPLRVKTESYEANASRISRLKQLLESPYFARIDFTEDGETEPERIYIGLSNLIDSDSFDIYIYDWRSPIASLFYRYELGRVSYDAPQGKISGEVTRKRQYEIHHGKLEYFFDANIEIEDEFLRRMLSKNASKKMKAIVETIQRDQDRIIRDTDSGLLMVQGAAGSGKTSVALHRVAYLMYQGLSEKLSAGDILILSPNTLFEEYISNVLPELGEKNVRTETFNELCTSILGTDAFEPRSGLYERLMRSRGEEHTLWELEYAFKTSETFVKMLDRLLVFAIGHLPFEDVYYEGAVIADRQSLKSMALNFDGHTPPAIRLRQIEQLVLDRVNARRKKRIHRLEKIVSGFPEHVDEVKQFARLLSLRESAKLTAHVRKFTRLDFSRLYRSFLKSKELFYLLAEGLPLPEKIEQVRLSLAEDARKELRHADALALSYLKLRANGSKAYYGIRQLVIDEAQDYEPLHLHLLAMLFPDAKITLLGDVNQTIGKRETISFYDRAEKILTRKKSAMLTLEKSFRCTSEITRFSMRFLDASAHVENFGRSGPEPEIVYMQNSETLLAILADNIRECVAAGFETIGLLTKSEEDAAALHERLSGEINVTLVTNDYCGEMKGVLILPVYMAKGLEFDCVHVVSADAEHYHTETDRQLLYVASTRALHRLSFYSTGEASRYLL